MIANDHAGRRASTCVDPTCRGSTRFIAARRSLKGWAAALVLSGFTGYFFLKGSPPTASNFTAAIEPNPPAASFSSQPVGPDQVASAMPTATRDTLDKFPSTKVPRPWNAESPTSALASARQQPEPTRTQAIIAIFESVANDRSLAVRLGQELLQEDVAQADADGTAVIGVLVRAGSFDAALDLAADGPQASRADWLSLVLPAMAARQPGAAAEIAQSLVKQGVDGSIFERVVHNWAGTDPANATDFALALPPGKARIQALGTAVDAWLKHDPGSVVNWLPSLRHPSESDPVLAALVIHTDPVFRPSATALAWTDRISDSSLRFTALEHVIDEWAAQDRAAARAYVEHAASRITTAQRAQLVARVSAPAASEPDSSL